MHRNRDDLATAGRDGDFDLDALLHPARAFAHPRDVAADSSLTLYEKRAILSSWASDACAVEAAPALREIPGQGRIVSFDEVMDALRALDDEFQSRTTAKPKRRPIAARLAARFRRRSDAGDLGSPQPAL